MTTNTDRRPVLPAPPWTRWAARLITLVVLPSCLWRLVLGLGIPVGFTGDLAVLYHAPGWITLYVIVLSLVCEGVALLAWGLVLPWGQRIPQWVPLLGGRAVPVYAAVLPAAAGCVALLLMGWTTVATWNGPANMGDPDAPHGVAGLLMTAAYAPMLLWSPLLMALTVSYWYRRHHAHRDVTTDPARRRRTVVGNDAGRGTTEPS